MKRAPVAIAHDYLTQRGGAERVVLTLTRAFPGATLHTTLYDPDGTFPEFRGLDVRTGRLQQLAPLRSHHLYALPLLPAAVREIEVGDVDVVVASSSGWAHGVRTDAPLLVYCHNTARWLHQPEDYRAGLGAVGRTAPMHATRPIRTSSARRRRMRAYSTSCTRAPPRSGTAF